MTPSAFLPTGLRADAHAGLPGFPPLGSGTSGRVGSGHYTGTGHREPVHPAPTPPQEATGPHAAAAGVPR
ncbi:hypothetical protein AMK16_20825 [Streptomyces sp. CB00455]|nr:hypothetical protein AMK16_20825 [Streptomyces sp. CB00455]